MGLARRGQPRATTPRSSARCSACRSSRRGAAGSRTSGRSSSANLAEVRKYPLTPHTDVTTRALGSVSRAFYDPDDRLHLRRPELSRRRVERRRGSRAKTGAIERLVDIKGPLIYTVTSLVWNPSDRQLYYTTDNGAHRDLVRLDPATGRTEVLQKDVRIGDLAYNAADRSIWGVRHLNGLATLVRIKPPYTDWERVITLAVRHRDVRPRRLAGRHAAVGIVRRDQRPAGRPRASISPRCARRHARRSRGSTSARPCPMASSSRPTAGTCTAARTTRACRTSSATTSTAKKLEAVSNTETGFFRPVPLADGRLLVFRYTGQGFVPRLDRSDSRSRTSAPIDVPRRAAGQRASGAEELDARFAGQDPVRHDGEDAPAPTARRRPAPRIDLSRSSKATRTRRRSASPSICSDPLLLNRLQLTAGWSPATSLPSSERLHLSADYERYDWRARASFNGADFYDLFGPTKVGRKGYSVLVGHRNTLIFDEPRRLELDLSGACRGNLDRLPDYQNVPVDVETLVTLKAALAYSRRPQLAWSRGRRDRPQVVARARAPTSSTATCFPRLHGTFDRGVGAARSGTRRSGCAAPAGSRRATGREPFANFFFGGFGNNYVDRGDEKRYRHVESFPGVELNEIAGRNFAKATLEWNLPPWRFARAGHARAARHVAPAGALRRRPRHEPRSRRASPRTRSAPAVSSTSGSPCSRTWT